MKKSTEEHKTSRKPFVPGVTGFTAVLLSTVQNLKKARGVLSAAEPNLQTPVELLNATSVYILRKCNQSRNILCISYYNNN